MKNKKKKGFTLIELLAIIVILAIVAVITVPIILNIIDNSRKGASVDSAYGYKDAVHTAYMEKLSTNKDIVLNGTYTVGSDGSLSGDFNDIEVTSLSITLSGTVPSSGTLTYSNNVLTNGCLVIGDYAVTFGTNGSTSTVKGTCSGSEQGGTTPTIVAPVIYASKGDTETKSVSNIAVGDYVTLGDNDGFYVINTNRNGNVVLMSEYNISNTATEVGYNNTNNNGMMLMSNTYIADATAAWRQDTSDNYDKIVFSDPIPELSYCNVIYWGGCVATSEESTYTCDEPYNPLYSDENYAFVYSSDSNLFAPMDNYEKYLKTTTKLTLTVRPMSYNEANSIINNSWSHIQGYWIGSESSSYGAGGGDHGGMWAVNSEGYLDDVYFLGGPNCRNDASHSWNESYGVRPVIEVQLSAFE